MSYLLDTHTFIWSVLNEDRLSSEVKDIIEDRHNTIYVSSITFWEISLKYSYGKLSLPGLSPINFLNIANETGFITIPLSVIDSSTYHLLKATWHRDPFDRMLIWQAIQQNLTLVTKDEDIVKYQSVGLKTVW